MVPTIRGSVKLGKKEGIWSPITVCVTLVVVGILAKCGVETAASDSVVKIEIWLTTRGVTPTDVEVPTLPTINLTGCSSMSGALF